MCFASVTGGPFTTTGLDPSPAATRTGRPTEFELVRRDERLHNLEHVLALGVRGFRYEYDFGDG